MNVSLNWLKDYTTLDLDPDKVSEILTEIGLEVEGQEEKESIEGGLKGLVVGEVVECGKHPDADRLSLTKVDVGAEENLQIVCGAPNVAAGQKVIVATVGTMLHPSEGEGFKIKKGKIRGQVSEGMICAEDEIGLGTSHDGIMVLPVDTKVGTPASEYFKVETDTVYEIGLTPNRSDATNHLGVAKDLAAAVKINYEGSGAVEMPDVSAFKVENTNLPIEVEVRNHAACPRYAGVCIEGVTVKESPDWLKNKLRSIGVRPISNIVDITNFILHELGQPLHAFDYEKINGQKIIVQTLPEGSKFQSLDEKKRSLAADDLMICDGDENGMCIGGVFGGLNSGVTDSTTKIFLESAHFDPGFIRRTGFRHDLRTDAERVFEKGSDPNVCVYALMRAALLIKELAGGVIASEIVDIYPNPVEKKTIEVGYAYVNRLIGVEIPKQEIFRILEALEMDILSQTEETFTVAVPTNKADVLRPADVAEEILRIYGLNKVPFPAKISTSLTYGQNPDPQRTRNKASDFLAYNGFNEMMALSLSQSRYYTDILPREKENLVWVNNTSTEHLDIMRPTMLFSGLEAIVRNQNRQNPDLKLFEFGRTYEPKGEGFKEAEHLSIFLTGKRSPESWHHDGKADADFFTLKSYVTNLLNRFGISGYQETQVSNEIFTYALQYHRGPNVLATFGKVNAKIQKAMDIKNPVFYADIEWDAVFKALKKSSVNVEELNSNPSVRRDLALVVDKNVTFSQVVGVAKKTGKKLIKDVNLFSVFEDESKLGAGKKSYAVSFIFEETGKTLNDKQIDKLFNQLITRFEKDLDAVIRR